MNKFLRNLVLPLALGALFLAEGPCAASAADYPSRPVVLLVAGPPAGGSDTIARILSAELAQTMGQSIVVENRAGASGIIGAKAVASSLPDGHMLLLGHTTHAIVPALVKPRPYDPIADFVPVTMIGSAPDLLVVSAKSGINNLADLLAKGKATGTLSYGSPGQGLPQHLAGFALAKASGVPMLHVPYRGSAPAATALLGGHVSMMFATPGAVAPFLKSGQMKAIAITSAQRSRFFPDVPTVGELGFPSVEETVWFGVFAPAGTPASVIQTLSTEIGRAVGKPEIRLRLEAMYLEPATDSSSTTFSAFVKAEVTKWASVVKVLGVSAE